MLCETCQQFEVAISLIMAEDSSYIDTQLSGARLSLPSYEAVIFSNLHEVEAATKSACSLCRCVSNCLDAHELLRFPASIVTIVFPFVKKGRGSLRARFEDRSQDLQAPVIKLVRSVATYAPYINSHQLLGTIDRCAGLENESTGSKASFEMASYWVKDCLENHPECGQQTTGWLPDRVIDVGPPDGSLVPRLVETSGLENTLTMAGRQYIALSHCWGSEAIIVSKLANFEQHKRVIAMEDLSRTFRDAVIATRKLNLRYLWIDSLCIIQDSDEDWKRQSVQMCTIYQRAIFTIMAAHASGGDVGLFVNRDGLAQLPFRLRLKRSNNEDDTISAVFLSLSRMSADLSFSLPLFTRAWVLQEQAISRARLIYYGEQVLWECQSARGSERCPNGGSQVSNLHEFTRAITSNGDPFMELRTRDAKGFTESLHSQWCILVENYMQRGITHTTDRLIAVDGLAQAIRQQTSNLYLAGLWRDQLVMGLMWYIPWDAGSSLQWEGTRKSPTYLSSRHKISLAPSWSWAAVTYPVEWPWSHAIKQSFVDLKVVCRIIQAETRGTPFEQSGNVSIEGMTRRLWIDPCYPSLYFVGSKTKDPKIKEWGISNRNYNSEWAWATCRASTKKPSSSKGFSWLSIEFHPDEIFDRNKEITFIALGEVPAQGHSFSYSRPCMLTLALYPTGRPGEYRRIGFAEWKNCSWYGYYCLGEDYDPKYWRSLKMGRLVGGWRMFVRELLEVLVILVFATLFQQPMIHLERDGLVWFRELAKGKGWWGQHSHDGEANSKDRYRRGWEPNTECLNII